MIPSPMKPIFMLPPARFGETRSAHTAPVSGGASRGGSHRRFPSTGDEISRMGRGASASPVASISTYAEDDGVVALSDKNPPGGCAVRLLHGSLLRSNRGGRAYRRSSGKRSAFMKVAGWGFGRADINWLEPPANRYCTASRKGNSRQDRSSNTRSARRRVGCNRNTHSPDNSQPSSSQTWYYCSDPAGYYPYVTQCNTGWQAVPAS